MFKKILIPLDGSELSERAIGPALKIARWVSARCQHAEVTFGRGPDYRVISGWTYDVALTPYVQQSIDKNLQETRDYLATMQKAYAQPEFAIKTTLLEGDTAGAIVDWATQIGADLIVMSTHGYSGLTRWALGSVTERVLSHALCPVLVIRSDKPMKHALITLDGSELAERALQPGLELASALGVDATLFRAVPQLTPLEIEGMNTHEDGLGLRMQEELADEAQAYMDKIANKATKTLVRNGSPAATIVEQVEGLDIDLLIMATHGYSGLRRWVYGSVTDKVMKTANVNMLIVRP